MKNINYRSNNSIAVLFVLLLFVIGTSFLSNDTAFRFEAWNYLIFQVLLVILAFTLKGKASMFLLSPSFIAVSYININFLLGSYFFKNGFVFTKMLPDYKLWGFYNYRIMLFNSINFLILISYFIKINLKFKRLPIFIDIQKVNTSKLLSITFFLLLVLSPFQFPFSTIPKSILAIILFILINEKYAIKTRILFYFLILLLFVLFSVHSKREAIFLLLPIMFLELSNLKNIKISFRGVLKACLAGIVVLYFILTMSILRGYGNYKADGFFEATKYVPNYITRPYFIASMTNNLEISYTYLHSNNAIEYLKRGKMKYTLGETFLKPLFVFFPSSFIEKPKNSIGYYTSTYDEEFRKRGGSYPISIQSEFYLNFGMYSLIFVFPFFLFFNVVYKNMINLIRNNNILNYMYLLYGFELFLILVRGSGLDIFTVYIIILLFFSYLYKIFAKVLTYPVRINAT